MRVPKPRVHALFLQGIADIQAAGFDATPDEIVWLYDLSERAINPNSNELPAFLDPAIKVGSIWLYPLSIQAHIWLDEYASEWWIDNPRMDLWSSAFAMAHSQTIDVFPKLTSRVRATIRINAWAFRHLTVSKARLDAATRKLLGDSYYVDIDAPEKKPAEGTDSTEWGDVIALVCSTYPAMKPADVLALSANTLAGLLANAPTPPDVKQKLSGTEIKALMAFKMAVKHIIKHHEKEADGEQGT